MNQTQSTTFSDTFLHNGNFTAINLDRPFASSLAIKDGIITWIGNNSTGNMFVGPKTEVIDLKKNFVYPGFIDTHAHILYSGINRTYLQLTEKLDKISILEKVKGHLSNFPQNEWIMGAGWDNHHWPPDCKPHTRDLDQITENYPIVLQRCDSHLIWVNSKALKLAGIDRNTPDPKGGKIEKDSSGNPTGILIDNAMRAIKKVMPLLSLPERIRLTRGIIDDCLQKGITTIHNASTDESDLEVFKYLDSNKGLNIRLYLMASVRDKLGNQFLEEGPKFYSPFLEMRCLKIWIDGALGSRGAALLQSYTDDPENKGLLIWEEKDLLPILEKAKVKGFQVAIHAIGDRANRCVLDMYEKIGVEKLRWRIEHSELLTQEDIVRFGKLGVIASIQPVQATSDMVWLANRLGEKRAENTAFLWRSLLENGAILVGGSDAPVGDFNPLWGLYSAITRQDHQGYPIGGWYPKEKLTMEEALNMYTRHAAYACFRENDIGTLEQGKFADMVVLPKNLMTCHPKELLDMKVIYTFVNGKIVYHDE